MKVRRWALRLDSARREARARCCVLTGAPGSTVTWSRAGYCSFTLTQGAVNFANNDKIELASQSGPISSCTPNGDGVGGPMQPAAYVSFCAEVAGATHGFTAEDWGAGIYHSMKGGMGKNSTDKVMWRLPTKWDYQQADINGIRMVMPDMGVAGTSRTPPDTSPGGATEWTASINSSSRAFAWSFSSTIGSIATSVRQASNRVRCVGR